MSQPLRILVIEDSAVDAELNLRELRRAGFEPQGTRVETEADFLAALHPPPDVILADYSLPQFDGLSALKRLREQKLEIPFILVSGVMGEENAVEAMKLGAADYLLKDRLARLGDAVKNALEEKQLRDAKRRAEESLRETNVRLQAANEQLRDARLAALNLMEDALLARQQAEQAAVSLQAGEQRIQQALQVSRSFTFEWHPATDAVRRSASFGTIIGLAGDTAIRDTGQNYFQRVHPDDRARFLQTLETLLPEAAEYAIEYRVLHADGGVVMLDEIGQGSFDAAGRLERLVGVATDVTQRKAAETALRESEARYRLLEETMLQGVVHQDAAGRIIAMNPAAENILGKPRGQFLGSSSVQEERDTIRENGEPFPGVEHPAMVALRTGQPARGVVMGVFNPQRGEYRWISIDAVPVCRPGEPRPAEVYTVFGDVTERKQAEQALREAHDQLERRVRERTEQLTRANTELLAEKAFSDSLIELAPAVIAVVDARGHLIRTNAYAEQLAGHPFADTEGRNVINLFVAKNERPRVRRLLRETLQGRVMPPVVMPLQSRNDGVRQIEWFVKPLANGAGQPSAVLAIGHDITESKRAEEDLRRSERNLANFFNQAPIGLMWLSAAGTILRANQAQLNLMGYAADEYLGKSFIKFGGDKAQGLELLRRLAGHETVRNFPMIRRCKDGTIRHVLVDANAFWSEDKFLYSSIFLRDITDRVKLEREVLQASEREHRRIGQDLHDGLGQVLVGAAYLTGSLEKDLAAKSQSEARQVRRIHEVINEAVAQTRSLARGLHPVEAEPNGLMVALAELAARTKKIFRTACHFNCPRPVLVRDNAVATHLFRIAQEAVTNAIKHGKSGRIEISLTQSPGEISLAVKDNGAGMPARPEKPGVGLRIMRYRAGMIGGALAIRKIARGGTAVICTVDLSGGGVMVQPSGGRRARKQGLKEGLKRKPKD